MLIYDGAREGGRGEDNRHTVLVFFVVVINIPLNICYE